MVDEAAAGALFAAGLLEDDDDGFGAGFDAGGAALASEAHVTTAQTTAGRRQRLLDPMPRGFSLREAGVKLAAFRSQGPQVQRFRKSDFVGFAWAALGA